MLPLSVAARQHSRCLQVAMARCRLVSAASAATSAGGKPLSPLVSGARTTSLVPTSFSSPSSSSSSMMMPFSTSAVSRSDDHVFEWKIHRALSLVQIPMFVIPFVWTNPVTDAIFCTLLVVHSHWGLEALAVDYIQPARCFGNTLIPKLAVGAVWALSAFTLGALYYFNYADVGLVQAIKMLWSL